MLNFWASKSGFRSATPMIFNFMLYPDSGIPMDEEISLGNMIWSYSKAKL